MKRLLGILLSIILCLQTVVGYAEIISNDADERDIYAAIALGLMQEDALDRKDENITRGEFVHGLMKLCGEDFKVTTPPLTDIDTTSPYYKSICMAYSLGYISGYGDGTFRETEGIAKSSAVRLLAYVAGYKEIITHGMSVSNAATNAGICSSVDATAVANLTVGEAAELFISTGEALWVTVGAVSDNGSGTFEKTDDTVFEKFSSIYAFEGKVTANEYTYLNDEAMLDEGMVVVNDVTLNSGDSAISSLLGMKVCGYYKQTEDDVRGTVIFACEDDNEVMTIAAEDIDAYRSGALYYYDENEKSKHEKFALSAVDVIYNNRLVKIPISADFNIESGNVMLIDNNDDRKVDVVKITSYETFVIDSVDIPNKKVYSKWNHIVLDFENTERVSFVADVGDKMYLQELTEWDVLSVARSRDGLVLDVVYATKVIEGKVTGRYTDGHTIVMVDDTEYVATKLFVDNQISDLEMGSVALFYLDAQGKIAAADFAGTSKNQYGYLLSTREGINDDAETVGIVKYLNANNEMMFKECAEKITLNGRKVEIETAINEFRALNEGVIIYRLDDEGKVTYIDSAAKVDKNGIESGYGTYENKDKSLTCYYHCNDYLDANNNGEKLIYNSTAMIWGGKVAVSTDTVVFLVPRPQSTDKSDENYNAYGIGFYQNDSSHDIEAYRVSSDDITADVIVQRTLYNEGSTEGTRIDSFPSVIERVERRINDDGEERYRVTYNTGGVSASKFVKSDRLVEEQNIDGETYKLQRGDIVKITTGHNGEISGMSIVYSYSKDAVLQGASTGTINGVVLNPSSDDYRSVFRAQVANVYKKNGSFFITTTSELEKNKQGDINEAELANLQVRNLGNYTILLFDTALNYNPVSQVSSASVIAYENTGRTEWSKVFMYDRYSDGRLLVLYK